MSKQNTRVVADRIVPKHLATEAYRNGIDLFSKVGSQTARYLTRVRPGVVELKKLPTPKTHKVALKTFLENFGYKPGAEQVVVLMFLQDVLTYLSITGVETQILVKRMQEQGWGEKAIATPVQILSRIGIKISTNNKGRNKTRWVNPFFVQETLVAWITGEATNIPTSKVVTMANRYVMEILVVDPSAKDSPEQVFEARCYGVGYVVFDRDTLAAFMIDVVSYEEVNKIVRVKQEVMASKLIVHDSETAQIGKVPFTTEFLNTLFLQGSVSLEIMGITTQEQFDHYIKLAARKGLDTEFEYRLDKVTTANKVNTNNKTAVNIGGQLEQVTVGETTIPTETRQRIGQSALQTNDGLDSQIADTRVPAYAGSSTKSFLPQVDLSASIRKPVIG